MRFTISIDFLENGQALVQAEGDPYQLGIFKETNWDLFQLLEDAGDAINAEREKTRASR